MYDPTTLDGMKKALLTEEPFLHYVRDCLSLYHSEFPEKPRILDVGCGWGEGENAIVDFFNGTLVGIDIDEMDIAMTRKKNQGDNLEFFVGDASNIKEIAPGPYDIVIARNMPPGPNFAHALNQCRKESSDSAVLFATFYTESDFELGKMSLSDAGFTIKKGGINPYYSSTMVKVAFGSDIFGIFGTVTPTPPSFLKRLAEFLRIK